MGILEVILSCLVQVTNSKGDQMIVENHFQPKKNHETLHEYAKVFFFLDTFYIYSRSSRMWVRDIRSFLFNSL